MTQYSSDASNAGRDMPGSHEEAEEVDDPRWCHLSSVLHDRFRFFLNHLAAGQKATLHLSNNQRVMDLNSQFRGQQKPTNVLSFPIPAAFPGCEGLGDVILSFDVVAEEAIKQKKSLLDHATHLLLHGLLHLLGYDHESEKDAAIMEQKERDLLCHFSIPDPYVGDGV